MANNKKKSTPTKAVSKSSTSKPDQTSGSVRLRQIQYRSYQHEIKIYHFHLEAITVKYFQSLLTRDAHGYVDTLFGDDTLRPLIVAEGNEVPPNCIEVAYLPSIFAKRASTPPGSALGFRLDGTRIEWVCFNQLVENSILNSWIWDPAEESVRVLNEMNPTDSSKRLFELVATMPKGITERRVRGANEEHKLWHDSLWRATLKPQKVKLTWKHRAVDFEKKQEIDRHKAKQLKALQVAGFHDEDVWASEDPNLMEQHVMSTKQKDFESYGEHPSRPRIAANSSRRNLVTHKSREHLTLLPPSQRTEPVQFYSWSDDEDAMDLD